MTLGASTMEAAATAAIAPLALTMNLRRSVVTLPFSLGLRSTTAYRGVVERPDLGTWPPPLRAGRPTTRRRPKHRRPRGALSRQLGSPSARNKHILPAASRPRPVPHSALLLGSAQSVRRARNGPDPVAPSPVFPSP